MEQISLSKTSYIEGLRCPRLLWLRINQPSLAEPPDIKTQYLFKTGHRVEEYARRLYPKGQLINNGCPGSPSRLQMDTDNAMRSDVPAVFEGSFFIDTMHCRSDILHDKNDGKWNLSEVKMCTKLKPEHIEDVAFQVCCIEESAHKIDRTYLTHINNKYIRTGDIDPHQLFLSVDITEKVREKKETVLSNVQSLFEIANRSEPPHAIYGSHCSSPAPCPFYGFCHKDISEQSILSLPYGSYLIPQLLSMGITKISDIPADFPLTPRQAALVQSAKICKPVVNITEIKKFLSQLKYPLFYLDFETANSCIPPYDNTSPYERLPFQYSLHVQKTNGGATQHFEFLPETTDDPRVSLLEELIVHLVDKGSIIAWNDPFEKSVLSNLANRFPQYADRITRLLPRFVDLIIPFRSGAYTDYRCGGSASLKKVLPVLDGTLSYTGMSINKGDDASLAFQQYIDGSTTVAEWSLLRKSLLEYCKLDSFAMVKILHVLYSL